MLTVNDEFIQRPSTIVSAIQMVCLLCSSQGNRGVSEAKLYGGNDKQMVDSSAMNGQKRFN